MTAIPAWLFRLALAAVPEVIAWVRERRAPGREPLANRLRRARAVAERERRIKEVPRG